MKQSGWFKSAAMAVLIFAIVVLPHKAWGQANLQGVLDNFKTPVAAKASQLAPGAKASIKLVSPTFFFVEENGKLLQLVKVELSGAAGTGLKIKAVRPGGLSYDNPVSGAGEAVIKVPDRREPAPLELQLLENGKELQTLQFDWVPAKQWKVYVSFVSHLDIGYTDLTENVFKKRNQITATALKYAEETKDWPEDARWRWTAEGNWEVKNFLAEHPEKLPELQKLAQEGRLEVCAKLVHMHVETAGYESLFRELYYGQRVLEPLLGTEVVTANFTDVAGIPWGEATVMPLSGIKYFQYNPNMSYRGSNLVHNTKFAQAYYWQGPDGGKILTWRSKDSYGEAPYLLTNYEKSFPKLTALLAGYDQGSYAYDAIHLTRTGPKWDNTIPMLEPCMVIREWDKNFAYPRLISATPKMFFEYLEKNFAAQIPTGKGDAPDWWADGVITEAKEEGQSRELHHRLFETEALASMAAVTTPGYSYPLKEIDQAFYNSIMFDEHTWGYHNLYAKEHQEVFQYKAEWLRTALSGAEKMQAQAVALLAKQIAGPEMTLVVFNPLSWERSALVSLKWNAGGYVKIMDPQINQELPVQFSEEGKDKEVYFIARDLSALGYKSFKVVPVETMPTYASALKAGNGVLENDRFILSFDKNNLLSSLKDKKLNRELLDGEAGQFIYRKQDRFLNIVDTRKIGKAGAVEFISGPVFSTARIKIQDPGNPAATLTQEIIIYDGLDYVDVNNDFQNYDNKLVESRYFAFPFQVPDFEIWVETPYGKMRPFYDQLPDYAKFYVVAHNVELRSKSENFSIVWSTRQAPMVELGEITKLANQSALIYNPGKYPWNPDRPTVYSEIMNNFQNTNFSLFQKGSAAWDYRIAAFDSTESDQSYRSGWELSSPAIAVLVEKGGSKLPASGSFVKVSPDNVMVTEFKMAEDGDGYILRIYEAEGKPAQVSLQFPLFKVNEVWSTDGVERNLEKLLLKGGGLESQLGPYEIKTIRVKVK